MSWSKTNAAWPSHAANRSAQSTDVLTQWQGELGSTLALESRAKYQQHVLSAAAQALLSLRTELNALLVYGTVLTVTADADINNSDSAMMRLSAQSAVDKLSVKLIDYNDVYLPSTTDGLALLFSAGSINELINQLSPICALLALPELNAYLRKLTSFTQLDSEKMQQNPTPALPHWSSKTAIHLAPLREAMQLQGAQLAQLESLASGGESPIARLQQLAIKRANTQAQLTNDINALQQVSGEVWRCHLTGDRAQMANQLAGLTPPINQAFSVAVLMVSDTPLTFFKELLP
ncbi:hypothetical protein [Shewanella surugensis]|uniref:Uncharacterized protein n=1 Tax=Shewanella surugensis TaxID=212020 RepID=A0ABT0L751_9GAMM|nr:hypothetical protein [Shewanella surugensis]MCL1123517.1 hypothetical protein [Shewanella surugensis]